MKPYFGTVCLVLLAFISSLLSIPGVGALKCRHGHKCEGKDCKSQGNNITSVVCPETEAAECAKMTFKAKAKEAKRLMYVCIPKNSCDALKKMVQESSEGQPYEDYRCYVCDTDNCNSAPKSAQGLGPVMLLMMVATVVSSILFGM